MARDIIRLISKLAFGVTLTAFASNGHADECWASNDMKGQSAFSKEEYVAQDDSMKVLLVCFNEQGGTALGSSLQMVRLGPTLAGYSSNGKGYEIMETYMVDRERGKMFYTRARVGTSTLTELLPDVVGFLVGSAVRADGQP